MLAGACPVLVWSLGSWRPPNVVAESGWLEQAQAWLWASSAVIAALALQSRQRFRPALNDAWLIALALLGCLRELDLHAVLNPETLGPWGVRYRLDWWIDASVPWVLKSLWAVVLGAVLAWVIVPPLILRNPVLGRLRRAEVGLICFIVGWLALLVGFAVDDLLRPLDLSRAVKYPLEEGSELLGAVLISVSVLARLMGWSPADPAETAQKVENPAEPR
jgi:hypothetical protein